MGKSMSRAYPIAKDGQWIQPVMKGYKMACCDCGLIHRLEFKVIKCGRGHKVIFRAWRDYRATAAKRRKP